MSNISIKEIRISPVSPISFYPSLLEVEFHGDTPLVFAATQTDSIRIKWWNPGRTETKDYVLQPNTLENNSGNVLIFDDTNLLIRNPADFFLPLPGAYQITLPVGLFQGQSIVNSSSTVTLAGGIANTTTKSVVNTNNTDFFIAIGSTADDRLIGGNKADFFEGGKGNDRIEGGGRSPLLSLVNGVITTSDADGRARDIAFYNADRSHFEDRKSVV
jgi:Ca2+-binding RTX toxin-like protein